MRKHPPFVGVSLVPAEMVLIFCSLELDRLDLYKQACLATEMESSNPSVDRLVIRDEQKMCLFHKP